MEIWVRALASAGRWRVHQLTNSSLESAAERDVGKATERAGKPPGATIFDDRVSNVTYTYGGRFSVVGQYFEGNNVYVYIHGKEDPEGDWWLTEEGIKASRHSGGVLVNCHFDSYVACSACDIPADCFPGSPRATELPTMACPV